MRVTSAKTRQAILVVDGTVDFENMPERLALFDENGSVISFDSAHGVPPGGDTDQVLVKRSADDYDVEWGAGGGLGLPSGGVAGDILVKASGTDGDADWEDPHRLLVYDMTSAPVVAANFSHVAGDVDLLADKAFNMRARIKFVWITGSAMAIVLRSSDTGDTYLHGALLEDGNLHIHERTPGGYVDKVGSNAASPVNGTTYWLELMVIGRDVVLRLFTAAPALNSVPVKFSSYTMAVDSKLLYRGRPGIRHYGGSTPLELTYERL